MAFEWNLMGNRMEFALNESGIGLLDAKGLGSKLRR